VSALAHILEAHGLATVAISLVRGQAASTAPPRALHCEFPLGRPFGVPGDAAFQHDVLAAAFALLDAPSGPVLVDYDGHVAATSEVPLTCTLPPPSDADQHPAIAEVRGLAPVFDRAPGGVELAVAAVAAEALIAKLVRLADGETLDEVGVADPRDAVLRVRSFYDRAARALADHVPGARSAESWFFGSTEAGSVALAARSALKNAGADNMTWFYMAPLPYRTSTP